MADENTIDLETHNSAPIEIVREKLSDAYSHPGQDVDTTPEEADLAGAFVEEAISIEDAMESNIDLPTAQ